jgi:deoxycitidine kinase/deoxyguanosine kinase
MSSTSAVASTSTSTSTSTPYAPYPHPHPIIISVDGNIGSGKSTNVNDLQEYFKNKGTDDIIFVQEPVGEWNSVVDKDGTPILANFYKDQKQYAFRLQMLAYISRLALLRDVAKKGYKYIITERCVGTDRNVFSKMLYDKGDIAHDEYIIYNKWHEEFAKDVPISAIVYIRASPETCLSRVNIRAREGENIPIEYLEECHRYHDEWIQGENIPKLYIDANTDFKQNPERKLQILKQIDDFIHSL